MRVRMEGWIGCWGRVGLEREEEGEAEVDRSKTGIMKVGSIW